MQIKRFTITLSLLFALASIVNASTQDWESKTYEFEQFNEVFIEGGYKVYLAQGEENKLVVKASDYDVFEYVKIKNKGNELHISIEPEDFEFDRIVLYITFKDLTKLHIEGGVKLQTKGYLDLGDFDMYVAGGAKIDLKMKAENIDLVGEGGVLFDLEGVTKSLDVKISGAGHIDAEELKAKNVSIKLEGVVSGIVYATEILNAKIEGVGKVKYKGDPKVRQQIEGLGAVSRI